MNRIGRGSVVASLLVISWLLISSPAAAQQTAPPAPPEKKLPAPLFPHHRRGFYKNDQGVDLVDFTPQSPPLDVDDPGVPDKGVYEINLTTRGDLSKDDKDIDLLFVDANYGLRPTLAGRELPMQLKVEFALAAAAAVPDALTSYGPGEANVGVKFNFYSNDYTGASAAFYPQFQFPASPDSAAKGLSEPGQALLLPLLFAKDLSYLTLVVNAAVRLPMHDAERGPTDAFSVGVGRAVTRTTALMAEIRSESSLDFQRHRLVAVSVGLIRGIHTVIVYARLGHSLFSDDDVSHTYVGAGVKLLLHQAK